MVVPTGNDPVLDDYRSPILPLNCGTLTTWSRWGISKSQPPRSKQGRLPLTLHRDYSYITSYSSISYEVSLYALDRLRSAMCCSASS
jgi:hypothetical protein